MIKVKKYKRRYFSKVYNFLFNNYTINRERGANASFFEYSQVHSAMDRKHINHNGVWFDGDKVVAYCAYEMSLGEAFFYHQKGYECLLEEMIIYAEKNLKSKDGKILMHPFSSQIVLRQLLKEKGYKIIDSWPMKILFYNENMSDDLPNGYQYFKGNVDPRKLELCLYQGFDHGETIDKYSPKDIYRVMKSPHSTSSLSTIIVNDNGNYVCFAGMWLEKNNHLAYLEPLCTIPSCRKQGLAKKAIGHLYKITKELGANHMTGGADEFYSKLGFEEIYRDELWEKR